MNDFRQLFRYGAPENLPRSLCNTLQCPIGTTSMHGARASVGLQGHLGVQKWSKMIFSKVVPRPLWVLKQVV